MDRKIKKAPLVIVITLLFAVVIAAGLWIVFFRLIKSDLARHPSRQVAPAEEHLTEAQQEQLAIETLNQFFSYLVAGQYESALTLFEPSAEEWEGIEQCTLVEDKTDRAGVLKDYCKTMETCLKSNVLSINKVGAGKYKLIVEFFEDNGEVYVLGPCCDETVETMPPVQEFEYYVEKFGDQFKVTTVPIFHP